MLIWFTDDVAFLQQCSPFTYSEGQKCSSVWWFHINHSVSLNLGEPMKM